MVEYTIAAIPTIYRDIQYRSRLEARWAAFFDLLGWQHTYEPYDLGVWSPDFLVRLPHEDSGSVLIEVKPVESICEDTLARMMKACCEHEVFANGNNIYAVVLVGVSPSQSTGNFINIGWLANRLTIYPGKSLGRYWPVAIGWLPNFEKPEFSADFIHLSPEGSLWFSAMGGDACGPDYPKPYADHTMGLWKRACNTVQWIGRQSP